MTEKASVFNEFVTEIRDICEKVAKDKGYNDTGIEGKNDLYEFVQGMSSSDSHALGEIIYKTVRFSKKGDKRDLIKIAAWAFLIYKYTKEK